MAQQKSRAPSRRRARSLPSGVNAQPNGPSRIRAIRPPRPAYDRRAAVARVLALWPRELADEGPAARRRILARLRRALRAERRRGLSGHWTYDLARHVELLRVYREELTAVASLRDGDSQGERPDAVDPMA
jgi:hypothetical protein